MRSRIAIPLALSLATTAVSVYPDVATPSRTPSFAVHDVQRSLTPFGWFAVAVVGLAVVFMVVWGTVRLIKRRRLS